MASSRRNSRSMHRPNDIKLPDSGSRSQSPQPNRSSNVQPRPGCRSPQFGSRSGSPTGREPGMSSPTPGGTRLNSRRNSMAESVRSRQSFINESIKHEVMIGYLSQQQTIATWIENRDSDVEGVILRKYRGHYLSHPEHLVDAPFGQACASLNLQSAMTVNSRVIKTFLDCSPDAVDVPLTNQTRVQVLPQIQDLASAKKNQNAAFIASEQLLVVWDDDAMNLMPRAKAIEEELLRLVMGTVVDEKAEDEDGIKKGPQVVEVELDEETGEYVSKRPTNIMNSNLVGVTLAIIVVLMGLGCRSLAAEIKVDMDYTRLAFLALTPVQIFFTLFFAQVIVGSIAQCIGPVKHIDENSRFYSGLLPRRIERQTLPHVTIQCPVYKEGLESVIMPTVKSIKQAITTYELQGGTANMFINDDGLQIIDEEEREARIDFYADHSIGWTARPKHGDDGFVRKGKFKKASNMNYGLMLSNNVEERLAKVERTEKWSQSDEAREYERCLKEVLVENGRAWADGNIRMGDYILLIDSDTRVPADCLLDAVSEMEQSPEVGIMQFSSGVMQVVNTYFENGITFFTNLIYTAIRYTVSNGDVAPFVGHNAILRWSAIQQVSFFDEDGYEKFWSESHVSEDFDMSLRLQVNNYIIRLAAWAGEGFKEGVSLTVYDELARWEKYAYGCNELLFHPMRFWLVRGPFTPLFRKFLFSNIRFTSKVTILSYIGTYYAIGAAWIMTTANYFAIGWFNGYLDKYYIDSWKVWFTIVLVFNGLGNVALAIMRYRTGTHSFFMSLLENFKWTLMLCIFLGGLSLHVSQALLSHMFEIDMTWGATAKEAEFSNFFIEVPKVLKKFKFSIAFALFMTVAMIVLAQASFVPHDWKITDFVAILPMGTVVASHFLLPIALNPALMTFSW
ncbi:hypothetical protein FKW77_009162 [Venturia effusa]|uniref:Uncharacterized protein n=1 Tax=Venturia effusa TaxID=50376 RepID=A0A517L423_9PEZI|nr:hypothetical protein FKW77_009162 [Venturia effusa]